MTNYHQQLSEKLAGLLGIEAYRYIVTGFTGEDGLTPSLTETWLTQDDGHMFRLLVEHNIGLNFIDIDIGIIMSEYYDKDWSCERPIQLAVDLSDHPNKLEATCVAIAKAIIAKEEE